MRVRITEGGRQETILSPAEREVQKQFKLYLRMGYSFHAALLKVRHENRQLSREFFTWLQH